jgi:ribosome maturation factor RimP
VLAGEYQLEVGSPGVDRPLTLPRHWRRNVSRLVAVNGLTGRVTAADDAGIVLEVSGVAREIAYSDLGPGKVQIEFTRLDEAVFADDDGDDSDDGDSDEESSDADDDDDDDEGEGDQT